LAPFLLLHRDPATSFILLLLPHRALQCGRALWHGTACPSVVGSCQCRRFGTVALGSTTRWAVEPHRAGPARLATYICQYSILRTVAQQLEILLLAFF
jgi:hypothetical protein